MMRRLAVVATSAACLWTLQAAATAHAATPASRVSKALFCGARSYEPVDGGRILLRNDVYVPGVFQCVKVTGRTGFRVVNSYRPRGTGGLVGSYPSEVIGCDMFGVCSKHDPLPATVSQLQSLTLSFRSHMAKRASMTGNDATDDWFTSGPLDGPASSRAELMLWQGWHGVGVATRARLRMCGTVWDLDWWVTGGTGRDHWNYLQVRNTRPRQSLTCNIMPVIRFFERQGLISPAWRPASMDLGFECWRACRGDAVTDYSVTVGLIPHLAPPS